MSDTPTTTRLGPDQATLRATMRRLAEATSVDAPIISAHVDLRPHAQGGRPGERNELTVLRDRLNAIGGAIDPHTPAGASFDADRERIDRTLAEIDLGGVAGAAFFACDAIGLWELVTSPTEFDTQISAGPTADLFQLARLLDESVSAVVAVIDTNTCRLFVTRRGDLRERPGIDEEPDEHTRHDTGGWSQARFQRHVDMQDKRFAGEIAAVIDRLVERERPAHVILAGDERAISHLDPELPERVRPLIEHVARIDMRATLGDVREEVAPILSALEEADGRDAADRAIAGHRAGALGVTGIDATMAALEAGQVDELVIDETADIDDDLRAELIRQASLTDAHVEIVRDHEELRARDGVGATLRFRIGD